MTPAAARRRVSVQPAERAPVAPRPPLRADDVIRITALPAYLRQHRLRVVRLDWPAGAPNPTLIVEDAPGDSK